MLIILSLCLSLCLSPSLSLSLCVLYVYSVFNKLLCTWHCCQAHWCRHAIPQLGRMMQNWEFEASPGYRMSSVCACAYMVRLCPMHKTTQQPASYVVSIPFNWIVVTVNLNFQLDAGESWIGSDSIVVWPSLRGCFRRLAKPGRCALTVGRRVC